MDSPQRLFRALHVFRLIRIHALLRLVVETILVALASIYNTLLLEFVVVTVFALLSIAFEGDTPFWDSGAYEPYENYTEALYSYYMCITLEGVNEVAEQILRLDSPQFTTMIGLTFYIFAAIVTYSVGQLLAGKQVDVRSYIDIRLDSAVIATTLGRAMDRITRDKTFKTHQHQRTRLMGLLRPSLHQTSLGHSRYRTIDERINASRLKPDDLVLLIVLFQILDKNIAEYAHVLKDLRHLMQSITKLNRSSDDASSSVSSQDVILQQDRLHNMIDVLDKILQHITDEGEILSPLGEFLSIERTRLPVYHEDISTILQTIEEKIARIQNLLRRNSTHLERNQRYLLLLDRFKERFFPRPP